MELRNPAIVAQIATSRAAAPVHFQLLRRVVIIERHLAAIKWSLACQVNEMGKVDGVKFMLRANASGGETRFERISVPYAND